MKTSMGLWIDHKKAVIVFVTDEEAIHYIFRTFFHTHQYDATV